MSWSNSYTHTLAIAVDMLTASVFWNTTDVTVSSLCGKALEKGQSKTMLGLLGRALNRLQAGHCQMAIKADLDRINKAKAILEA